MVQKVEEIEGTNTFFVENLSDNYSVFRHSATGVKFAFERRGVIGSVIEVPEKVVNDPYFQRAIKRGRLRILDRDEAAQVMQNLRLPEEGQQTSLDLIQEALSEGAAERSGSRYVRDNLPDTGRELGEIAQEDIWQRHREETGTAPSSVVRSASGPARSPRGPAEVSDSVMLRSPTDIDGPLPPEVTLTEPVRQGEWAPDTGIEEG